jgi:DNA helicase-2/ATP-dependent DNA helicase PcrA
MLTLSEKHDEILSSNGHILVTGGPGCGKTTISIVKAKAVAECQLHPGQNVLFLSFARATVSRVIEAMQQEHKIEAELKGHIRVETYHAFFWSILKTHGYLLGLPRQLSILLPKDEAIALSAIRSGYGPLKNLSEADKKTKIDDENRELSRLAYEEGRVCFGRFAQLTGELLHRSKRLRALMSLMYPYVILDEFQDTNAEQWNVITALSEGSVLFALADPEQRIYEWAGADPKRLNHFRNHCTPTEVNLGGVNHRSQGTEICAFGDDILKGQFRQKQYTGITLQGYESNKAQAFAKLVGCVLQSRKRLLDSGRHQWSLAILTPTKLLTRQISDSLRSPPANLPPIRHTAIIDVEGAVLAAELISSLLQAGGPEVQEALCVEMLCNFYRGKGGDEPSQTDLKEAISIRRSHNDYIERKTKSKAIKRNSLLVATINTLQKVRDISLTGDPDQDWLAIREVLDRGKCKRLHAVAQEVKNIRLLERGTQLRQALSDNWNNIGRYPNALEITRQAFVQEHFEMAQRPEQGVVVMNMHKAKGKQFDEVIIFEGWPIYNRGTIVANVGRIVWENLLKNAGSQARQNFRVSITRAKQRTTILTPKSDPCVLLTDHSK